MVVQRRHLTKSECCGASRLNGDQDQSLIKVDQFVFDAFINSEPAKRLEDKSDVAVTWNSLPLPDCREITLFICTFNNLSWFLVHLDQGVLNVAFRTPCLDAPA